MEIPGDPVTVSGERAALPLRIHVRRRGAAVIREPGNLLKNVDMLPKKADVTVSVTRFYGFVLMVRLLPSGGRLLRVSIELCADRMTDGQRVQAGS